MSKSPIDRSRRVRRATKSEMESRALKAMSERTQMLQRLQENEIIIAAMVAQQGRVRLSPGELQQVGQRGEELSIRQEDDGTLVLELVGGGQDEVVQSQGPSEGVAALIKGGMRVVEHDPEGDA